MTPSQPPIAVVGGGVIGLCTAYYLRQAGADVAVLEQDRVGAGASYGNAGWVNPSMIAPLPEPGILKIAIKSLVDRDSPLYVSAREFPRLVPWMLRFLRYSNPRDHLAGLRATGRLAERTMELYDGLASDGVDCRMEARGVTVAALRADKAEHMLHALEPLHEFGYRFPTTVCTGTELRELDPGIGDGVGAGFHIPGERTVHPATFLASLTDRLREMGVEVSEGTRVTGVDADGGRVSALRTTRGRRPVRGAVLATGAWSGQLGAVLGVRLPIIAGKGYSAYVQPRVVPRAALYLPEAKIGVTPYGERIRMAGTMELSGLNTAYDSRRMNAILRAAAPYLTEWKPDSIDDTWVGMRPLTPDGLPILGKAPQLENLHLATGHSMLGVTLGPATGALLAESILSGRAPEQLQPFRAERFARR